MTATPTKGRTGSPTVLARYECNEGARQLVGQRIHGTVALIDLPAGDEGKVYLIEPHVTCKDELDGIVADYLNVATELDRPPMQGDWILT